MSFFYPSLTVVGLVSVVCCCDSERGDGRGVVGGGLPATQDREPAVLEQDRRQEQGAAQTQTHGRKHHAGP